MFCNEIWEKFGRNPESTGNRSDIVLCNATLTTSEERKLLKWQMISTDGILLVTVIANITS